MVVDNLCVTRRSCLLQAVSSGRPTLPNEFAERLAALGFPGAADLEALLGDLGNPNARDELEAWAAGHQDDVLAAVRDQLPPIPPLRAALPGSPSPDGWRPHVELGPARVSLDSPAATVLVGGQTVVVGILPPDGAAFELNAPGLSGGGAISRRDVAAWGGALGLRLGSFEVKGIAIVEQKAGQPSLVVVLGIRFLPPIQLSFGFALSGVGGVVGVNRRIDGDALRARLASGTALDVFFPDDPVAGANRLLDALAAIFLVTLGQHTVGPTFSLTWLDIGAVSLVRVDIGVLVQPPDAKVLIVGRAMISLPVVLALRLDLVGEIDPGRKTMAIDAVLVDSRALAIFRVTGTATFRLSWGSPPNVVAAVGGFYPGFRPEPANIPPQERLGLALDVPCPLTIRAGGYLAITSNTFQAGADIEVGIDLSVISASGFLKFDAIVHFDPFHIHADYEAGWEVDVAIFSGGTTVSGWIDGPGPWTVHARVSISLLIDDFTWSDTFRFGPPGPSPDPPIPHLSDLLAKTMDSPAHLRAADALDADVAIQPQPGGLPDGAALVSPLATLRWQQDVTPLRLPVIRGAGRRLESEQQLDIEFPGAVAGKNVEDWFAPGTYLELTDAEALSLPPFQLLAAGLEVNLAVDNGQERLRDLEFETFIRTGAGDAGWSAAGANVLSVFLAASLRALAMSGNVLAAATVEDRSPLVTVRPEAWSVSRPGETSPQDSAAGAFVAARDGGWVAHATADNPIRVGAI